MREESIMAVTEGTVPHNLPGRDAPAHISTWQEIALNRFWLANSFPWQPLHEVATPPLPPPTAPVVVSDAASPGGGELDT
jgi:hypothetical protein